MISLLIIVFMFIISCDFFHASNDVWIFCREVSSVLF